MIWKNLRDGLCPKCSAKLNLGLLDVQYSCTNCTFKISKDKFETIAFGEPAFARRVSDIEDNLHSLNNLGRPLIMEDFSDSPFKV